MIGEALGTRAFLYSHDTFLLHYPQEVSHGLQLKKYISVYPWMQDGTTLRTIISRKSKYDGWNYLLRSAEQWSLPS
jgi:hypothetical protein